MIKRKVIKEVKTLFSEFPIVAIVGPRQSGKTTLAKTWKNISTKNFGWNSAIYSAIR